MSVKGTGLALSLGMLATIVGYVLWVTAIGFNTASDDIATVLTNSASGSTTLQIASILILVGLVAHGAGLISTRGTSAGTALTASPPFVIMGWTLMLSSSLNVSRLKLMAVIAIIAAFRALTPRWGAPPA